LVIASTIAHNSVISQPTSSAVSVATPATWLVIVPIASEATTGAMPAHLQLVDVSVVVMLWTMNTSRLCKSSVVVVLQLLAEPLSALKQELADMVVTAMAAAVEARSLGSMLLLADLLHGNNAAATVTVLEALRPRGLVVEVVVATITATVSPPATVVLHLLLAALLHGTKPLKLQVRITAMVAIKATQIPHPDMALLQLLVWLLHLAWAHSSNKVTATLVARLHLLQATLLLHLLRAAPLHLHLRATSLRHPLPACRAKVYSP